MGYNLFIFIFMIKYFIIINIINIFKVQIIKQFRYYE